jgi:hypothetical protein
VSSIHKACNPVATSLAKLGPTEISKAEPLRSAMGDIDAAIDDCVRASNGGYFSETERELGRILRYAYALYLLIKDNIAAEEHARAHHVWTGRTRRPNKGNTALLAVMIALNPTTSQQRSLCGDWANLLIDAAYHHTGGSDFEQFAEATTLKESIRSVRARKRREVDTCLRVSFEVVSTDGLNGVKQTARVTLRFTAEDAKVTAANAIVSDDLAITFVGQLLTLGNREAWQPVLDAASRHFNPFGEASEAN